jgi:hypothetical protein
MRVKNFLDISLLQIWETWNFMGKHMDVSYIVFLVGNALEVICFETNLLSAAIQSNRVQPVCRYFCV